MEYLILINESVVILQNLRNFKKKLQLESLLLKYNAGLRLAVEDFHQGAWSAALSAALKLKSQGWTVEQEKSPVTAAETIVKALIDIVNNK